MNINKFTQKSAEALNNCEKLAYEYGNQEIDQEEITCPRPVGLSLFKFKSVFFWYTVYFLFAHIDAHTFLISLFKSYTAYQVPTLLRNF